MEIEELITKFKEGKEKNKDLTNQDILSLLNIQAMQNLTAQLNRLANK